MLLLAFGGGRKRVGNIEMALGGIPVLYACLCGWIISGFEGGGLARSCGKIVCLGLLRCVLGRCCLSLFFHLAGLPIGKS